MGSEPGIDTQLRAAGRRDEGLEKAMAFSAVRRALVGDDALADELGKYAILERLGAGGMGAVFAAWDRELERRVALKVLTGGAEAEAEQAQIMREAKAAAQLSHPNVVTVFEVGAAAGRVFLAMEYVRGQTLRAWAKGEFSGRARLDVLLQAGRGLAAAHGRGLVHRDFKPDNVLVDAAGRAKVADFGLAHSSAEQLRARDPAGDTPPERAATITQTGSHSGTPDYMAPEQLRGGPADARSDQFAFAVTAWEVLCGTRPFEDNANPESAPRRRAAAEVPRTVMQALERALSVQPGARFESMDALLAQLDPAPLAARRARWMLGAAGALAVGSLAWGLQSQRAVLCTGLDAALQGAWDDARRDRLARAFAEADPTRATEAWQRVEGPLQRYADDWVEASKRSCEATRLRGEQSEETYTRSTQCLATRRRALEALTGRLLEADASTLARAEEAIAALPAIEACDDPRVLTALVEPPPQHAAARVEELRETLASVSAAERLGQYAHVAEVLGPFVEEARASDYRPLHAEANLLDGRVHRRMKTLPESRAALERAVEDALATGHDRILANALSHLALVVGHDLGETEVGLTTAGQAQAALDRLGGDAHLQAELAARRGLIHLAAGNLARARAELMDAHERFEDLWPGGIQTGDTLNNLANVSIALGKLDRASDELAAAIEILERYHGPNHPAVGSAVANRAIVLRRRGLLDDARSGYRRARAIFEDSLGPEHPQVAAIDLNLGNVEMQAGNAPEALALLEGAVTRLEAALGPEHAWVAASLKARGEARAELGRDGARADLERAVEILGTHSPKSLDLAGSWCALAALEGSAGDAQAAAKAFDRAFAVYARALGEDAEGHRDVTLCREAQAEVASAR